MIGLEHILSRGPRHLGVGLLVSALLLLGLSGCAGQAAFLEGKRLVEQDRVEEGLVKLQQAMSEDPRSGEYRIAFAITRDRALSAYLEQADRFKEAGQYEEASRLYRRVQGIQPGNDRARSGMQGIERQARQKLILDEARQAMEAKDWSRAKARLTTVLLDAPSHEQALAMQREVESLSAPPPVESGLAAAYKKPISIEFKDVPLKQAFEVLSKTSGLNFVFDKDVKGDQKTSIFLRNSTVESVLYFLLLTNQLEQQVMNGNTLLIYPNIPAKQKDYQELSVRTFQMVNTDAKSVGAALKTLFKGRDIVVDDKLNMLVVRDTPEALKLVEKLVALHDVAEPEVMLEVEILEVSRNKLMELGVRWPESMSFSPLASDSGAGLTVDDLRKLGANAIGVEVGAVKVNARKEDTSINILANPRIRAVNHEKAKILIGDRVPNITVTSSPQGGFAESINYLDVGLKLEVEPTIYRGNDIVIKVGLEVSSIAGAQISKLGTTAYTIGTRNANTTLRLKDGENQVLAGLINDEDRRTANKIPGVGDLPVVGRLFGSSLDEGRKSEIVLSITPRLVRNVQRTEPRLQEFRSGTENSLRERPEAPAQSVQVKAAVTAMAGKSTRTRLEDGEEGDAADGGATAQPVVPR